MLLNDFFFFFLFLPDGGEDAIVAFVGCSQDAERGVVF
jgi:hypothetical protein